MTAGGHRRGPRLRTRLGLTVVGVVTVAAVGLSVLAFALVSDSLRGAVLDDAVAEARFNVEVLADERLGTRAEPGDITASGLADDFARRDLDVYVDFGAGEDFASGLDVVSAPEVLSPQALELVDAGNIAAERVTLDGTPHLIVAVPKPPAGPDFYFFTEVDDVEAALRQLRLVLFGASLLLVVIGGVAGWRVARLTGSLADSVDELMAARDRERRFVADVSHELRTPVTALVHATAELSDAAASVPAGTRRVVELLHADVRRLRDLVEELLELSRLDAIATDTALDPVEIDMHRFLDAVVTPRLPSAEVDAGDHLRVRTDRRRLERIVANLVDNARVHAGGVGVRVRARSEGGDLVIEVTDRGPGVDGANLQGIFERFAKRDPARAAGGSGLGLAIVREHARLLGATVTAQNREQGGLAVVVCVPGAVVTEL